MNQVVEDKKRKNKVINNHELCCHLLHQQVPIVNIDCRKLAKENDIDPYQDGFPYHLPKLSRIEEMLIACVYPVMKTYCLKGGTTGYKGDVLNIEQDTGGLVSTLP